MKPDGSNITDIFGPVFRGDVEMPAWSPDSSKIIFVEYNPGTTPAINYDFQLFEISSTGGTPQELYADNNGVGYPSWWQLHLSDITPPVLNLPSTITQDATSSQGATVNYAVTATDTDNSPSELTINCTPTSGSIFPIGTTTVNCSASDPAGNTTNGSFTVVIKGASGQTIDLTNLVNSLNLSGGGQNSFDVKIQNIITALSTNDTTTACGSLTAFINEVNAKKGKTLTTSQAEQLLIAANQIGVVIGCN